MHVIQSPVWGRLDLDNYTDYCLYIELRQLADKLGDHND